MGSNPIFGTIDWQLPRRENGRTPPDRTCDGHRWRQDQSR